MLPKMFLSDYDISETMCTMCGNYLSVSPIIIHSNDIVCGRCVREHKLPEDSRAYFYENLAKFMFFPCKNDVYGCTVSIPWGKVLAHETGCIYKSMICPAVDCEADVISDDIIKHFESKHKHLVQKDSQFHIPQDIDSSINKLFIWKNQHFIIQAKNEAGDIFFRISNTKGDARKILMYIKGKSSSSSICLNKFAVKKYDSKLPTFSDEEKININALKNVLGPDISCELTFDNGAKLLQNTNDSKFFSELECPVCTVYMRPPIYMCSSGHSLCKQCKSKLQKCPSCSCYFSNSRNYSLEKIAEIVTYPCKNKDQGCDFVADIDNISDHESKCSVSYFGNELTCFNRHCSWKGTYAKAFQHISASHPDSRVSLGMSRTITLSSQNDIQLFLQYDRRIFMLHIKYQSNSYSYNNDDVRWAVSCISKEKILDQYMFFLEITRDQRILSISGNCERIKPPNLDSSQFISISKSLINDFGKENKITFKLNISASENIKKSRYSVRR